jgi:uncharacterized protein
MTRATILTLANGRGVDLDALTVEDIDFAAFAEHVAKEKRFNGATPDVEYSVAQHMCLGSDAILAAGGTETEAAYFHLHDLAEAIWKDDTTPKKAAIAQRVSTHCGVSADGVLSVLNSISEEHDAVIHQAAGLPWPMPKECKRVVKLYDAIMFVTEWRDLMHDIVHPHWALYSGIKPLNSEIKPWPWAQAKAAWLYRANRLVPALRMHRPVVAERA